MQRNIDQNIDQNTSRVFNLLKVLSIFMVLIGHFFKEYDLLWVPVTVGLIVFGFSSGFFTSIKYKGNFSREKFWRKKIERLGMSLLVINIALFVLFLIQERQGIWTWYSMVNVVGLGGFLNWFGIPNLSPFGAGMWFFTLLLIFYLFYPLMEKMSQKSMTIFTVLFTGISFYLSLKINFGHSLWLTASGFVIGVWADKLRIEFNPNFGRIMAVIILALMVLVNFKFEIKVYNFFFILLFSFAGIYSCLDFKITETVNDVVLFFSGCMLEIYLIHGYFFMSPTQYRLADFMLSLITIAFLAKMLSILSLKLNQSMAKDIA